MLQDAEGHVLTSVAQVGVPAPVTVRLADGRVLATTSGTEMLEEDGHE